MRKGTVVIYSKSATCTEYLVHEEVENLGVLYRNQRRKHTTDEITTASGIWRNGISADQFIKAIFLFVVVLPDAGFNPLWPIDLSNLARLASNIGQFLGHIPY